MYGMYGSPISRVWLRHFPPPPCSGTSRFSYLGGLRYAPDAEYVKTYPRLAYLSE